MSLSRQILIGLTLGVLTGVFFGERVAFLQVGAEIYVKLLQMTVLPYVTVSLISGLGRLDARTGQGAWPEGRRGHGRSVGDRAGRRVPVSAHVPVRRNRIVFQHDPDRKP